MLESLIGSTAASSFTVSAFLICSLVSVLCGLAAAAAHMYKTVYSKGFIITVAVLPVVVQMVIMLVNGNLGTGIAVAGAFSLVRFRSVPGSAKDICSIFLAVVIGLATGTGFIFVAIFLTVLVCGLSIVYTRSSLGRAGRRDRVLKITIPEDLDYSGMFDDLFEQYTASWELVKVKTVNMGSLFKVTYKVTLKDPEEEKKFIDEIRCRNGNLDIVCGQATSVKGEL